jgi:serine/threonine protein kinase
MFAQPPPPADDILRWIKQVAAALDHAHRVGLLHRDVKWTNVLLDARDDALLADFGLALMTRTDADRAMPGTGTPTHLEPEQWRGQGPCAKSDVYSFGVFVWEVVSRQRPWRGLEASVIREAVVGGSRLVIPADAPPVFAEVMRRCFSPRDTRPSMQEVLRMLTPAESVAAPHVAAGASDDVVHLDVGSDESVGHDVPVTVALPRAARDAIPRFSRIARRAPSNEGVREPSRQRARLAASNRSGSIIVLSDEDRPLLSPSLCTV